MLSRNNFKYLPIKAHIVGRDEGTGYYRLSNLGMVSSMKTLRLRITILPNLPLSYLDNTTFTSIRIIGR